MIRLSKTLFFILITMLAAVNVQAQAPTPIKWRVNVKTISATEGEVIITATIDDGWHLYGTNMPENGPVPTKFNFEGSKGIKLTGSLKPSVAPVTHRDKSFGMDLNYWLGKVTFRQRFKIENPADATLNLSIRFMGCNDQSCLPPRTVNFTKKVQVK